MPVIIDTQIDFCADPVTALLKHPYNIVTQDEHPGGTEKMPFPEHCTAISLQ